MPGPVDKFDSRIREVPNDVESEIKALISNSQDPDQYDVCDDFVTTTNIEPIAEIDPGPVKVVNNIFRHPIDTDGNATGTVIKEDGILYVQKYLMNEFYYKS